MATPTKGEKRFGSALRSPARSPIPGGKVVRSAPPSRNLSRRTSQENKGHSPPQSRLTFRRVQFNASVNVGTEFGGATAQFFTAPPLLFDPSERTETKGRHPNVNQHQSGERSSD